MEVNKADKFNSCPDKVSVLCLLGIVHRNHFEAKAGGRIPGVEFQNSHYRKGRGGDWRNHFYGKVKERFRECHGELVIKLGYSQDMDW